METFRDQINTQFQFPLQNPVLIFALILLIILIAPILFKKLKVPGIIGLIIAGVIVGPHGLNLLAQNSAIELFSTIGLLYIMFITGLELEIHEFRRNRIPCLGFGFLTFTLPLLIGFPACYFILRYDLTASLLTASIFSTQTMVAYPIVTKFGISQNKAVAVTVGGTIFTDTAVLLMLAVITGVHTGHLPISFWIRIVVGMMILLLFMFQVVPRITKWFFIRLEGEKTSHYVFVLCIVFLSAFIAQLTGLEPIIGAFIAGLALNRLVPQSSMLMNRIQFVGNALFIPFFLISVGMLVDMKVLFKGPWALWIAFVLIIVALVAKYLAARITQHLFGFSKSQGLLIFGLSSSHAAACMAVILVGFKAGIIDENILNGTIILILVTCLVAAFATEKAAKSIVIAEEKADDSHETDAGESLLVSVANLMNSDRLLEFTHYIRDKKNMIPLRVLSVINTDGESSVHVNRIKSKLDKKVQGLSMLDSKIETIVAAEHNIPAGINRITKELGVQTIVCGWPVKETLTDKIFGHKMDHLLETSEVNIVVCKLINPLATYKQMVFLCPPFTELEQNFDYLIRKVATLSKELNLIIHLYSCEKTRQAIQQALTTLSFSPMIKSFEVEKIDGFNLTVQGYSADDMLVVFSGRAGSVSYQPELDHLVEKISTTRPDQSIVLFYPGVDLGGDRYDKYRDFSSQSITRSMERFERFQKGLVKTRTKAE